MQTILQSFGYIFFMPIVLLTFSCKDSTQINNPDPVDNDTISRITLCNQSVMKMNLSVDRYRDGTPIREAQTNSDWIDADAKGEGAWCYYSNNSQFGVTYGKLYNWHAVNNPKGLAPTGWRIPTDEELDGLMNCTDFIPKFGTLLGGGRYPDGMFLNRGQIGIWWTSTGVSASQAKAKGYMASFGIRMNYTEMKGRGFSILCIK